MGGRENQWLGLRYKGGEDRSELQVSSAGAGEIMLLSKISMRSEEKKSGMIKSRALILGLPNCSSDLRQDS